MRDSHKGTLFTLLMIGLVVWLVRDGHAVEKSDDDLTVDVNTSELSVISDPYHITVSVFNGSDHSATVLGVFLELPPQLPLRGEDGAIEFPDSIFDLAQGDRTSIELRIEEFVETVDISKVFFKSSTYQPQVRVEYSQPPDIATTRTIVKELEITPLAPWWAVVVGGCSGVVLLIVFRFFWSRYRQKEFQFEASLLITLGFGCTVVALAVLIFRYTATEVPQLPIEVQVKDFYGGLLLGFLFEPLGSWLTSLIPTG